MKMPMIGIGRLIGIVILLMLSTVSCYKNAHSGSMNSLNGVNYQLDWPGNFGYCGSEQSGDGDGDFNIYCFEDDREMGRCQYRDFEETGTSKEYSECNYQVVINVDFEPVSSNLTSIEILEMLLQEKYPASNPSFTILKGVRQDITVAKIYQADDDNPVELPRRISALVHDDDRFVIITGTALEEKLDKKLQKAYDVVVSSFEPYEVLR